MKMKENTHTRRSKSGFSVINILKGSCVALCSSLLLVLIFAFLLKFTNIPERAISPVNQVIKGVSVLLGVMFGLKKSKEMGLISGLSIGALYTILAFFVFSILAGSINIDATLLIDLLFGGIIGAVCGIICINLKKSSN